MRRICKSQPHSLRVRPCGDTLCPDNGGVSGVGYLACGRSLCNSEVHSAMACASGLHRVCERLAARTLPDSLRTVSARTRPRLSLWLFGWRHYSKKAGATSRGRACALRTDLRPRARQLCTTPNAKLQTPNSKLQTQHSSFVIFNLPSSTPSAPRPRSMPAQCSPPA